MISLVVSYETKKIISYEEDLKIANLILLTLFVVIKSFLTKPSYQFFENN